MAIQENTTAKVSQEASGVEAIPRPQESAAGVGVNAPDVRRYDSSASNEAAETQAAAPQQLPVQQQPSMVREVASPRQQRSMAPQISAEQVRQPQPQQQSQQEPQQEPELKPGVQQNEPAAAATGSGYAESSAQRAIENSNMLSPRESFHVADASRVSQSVDETIRNAQAKAARPTEQKQEGRPRVQSEDEQEFNQAETGINEVPEAKPKETHDYPSKRASKSERRERRDVPKTSVSKKFWKGVSVYGKAVSDRSVAIDHVSISVDVIEEVMSIPGNGFIDYIQSSTETDLANATALDVMEVVNANRIPVGVFKTPNLEPESACQLYLSIHDGGRDIRIHPMAAKKFNADFDGDAVTVSTNARAIRRVPNPMRYLMNLAGDLTLDLDFFPRYVSGRGVDSQAHRETVVRQLAESTFDRIPSGMQEKRSLANLMADVYFKSDKTAMQDFVRGLSRACTSDSGQLMTDRMADTLTRTYDDLKAMQLTQAGDGVQHYLLEELPAPKSFADRKLFEFTEDLLDDVVMKARGTMNFQDLKALLCEYLGEPAGTNPSFRFTANVAKMFKNIDSRVQIGSEVEMTLDETLDGVLKFVESRKISNALFRSENAKSAKETMRSIILSSVGFPRGYASFGEFLDRFVKVYRRNQIIINGANLSVYTDMRVRRNSDDKMNVKEIGANPTAAQIANSMMEVYGDFRVSDIFTNIQFVKDEARLKSGKAERDEWNQGRFINAVFGTRTLRQLSSENKFRRNQKSLADHTNRVMYGANGVQSGFDLSILYTIIDMRSSGSSNFNTQMFGNYEKRESVEASVMGKLLDIIERLDRQLSRDRDSLDWFAWVNDLVDVANEVNPNVYAYFNMDNADGFFNSKYGDAMLQVSRSNLRKADKIDRIGSIYIAMVTEYRMSRVKNEQAKLAEIESRVNVASQGIEDAINAVKGEQDILASSSFVWRTIVKELRSDNEVFNRLKAGAGRMQATLYKWGDGRLSSHESLLDVLTDVNIGKVSKCSIVADVVRDSENFPYFEFFEVPAQLEADPSSTYSTLPPTSVGIMASVNEFDSSYDRLTKRSFDAMQKDIDDAYRMFGSQQGALERALSFYAENQDAYIELDSDIFIDAICSTLDKQYAQSEKSRQHPWTNAIYSALSAVRNFGLFSDVYRTDDRALGLVYAGSVSSYDIVGILADPSKSMWVYTDNGRVVELTRDTLVGKQGANEADVWQFLRDNPRVASCLRKHRSCVTQDGTGYIGAVGSVSEFIESGKGPDVQRRIRYELYDHPSFAAMVAIMVPTRNRSSRTMRGDYESAARALQDEIEFMAGSDVSAESVLKRMHLTEQDFINAGVSEDAASELYGIVNSSLNNLANAVRLIASDVHEGKPSDHEYKAPDLSACYNYYDVRQEFSGSKTNVSTGVEGSETWKLASFISMLQPEDRYGDAKALADVGDLGYSNLIEQFGDCLTQFGVPLAELDKSKLFGEREIVIEVPEGFIVPDKTLDSYGRQVSSACSYLIVKRDAGAEKFNLKAKKTGDDGLDSVTKHGKYFTDAEIEQLSFKSDNYGDLLDKINLIYNQGDPSTLFQAKVIIANRLYEANRMCGYDEMTLANCMSLADLMVAEDPSGVLRLRSISMIAKAIKSKITYDFIDRCTPEDMRSLAREAAAEAGIESFDVLDVVAHIQPKAPAYGKSGLIRPRSSSWERNYNLIREITRSTGFRNLSKEEVAQRSSRVIKNADQFIADSVGKAGFTLLGYNGDREQNIGPENVWYIDSNLDSDRITQALRDAWRFGISVMVPRSDIGSEAFRRFAPDVVPFPSQNGYVADNYVMIPFFDMRLNGSEAFPVAPGIGTFKRPADNVVWSYEDSLNEFGLGDAAIQFFKSLVDRIKINWSDSTQILVSNMFPNVYEAYPDAEFRVHLATAEEIGRIANPACEVAIDVGVAPAARGFDQHWNMVMNAVDAYVDKWRSEGTDKNDGGLVQDAEPGDVVGFVTIEITERNSARTMKCYAPIIPFDLQGTNDVSRAAIPSKFHIRSMDLEMDNVPSQSALTISWDYSDDITDHTFKFFEGQGAANKFVASASQAVEGPTLKNGIALDACYAPESTASRRIGTNKRVGTLQTLMLAARTEGYNFAEHDDSFPDDPVIPGDPNGVALKQRLLNGYVTRAEWSRILESDITWHKDPRINAFVKQEVGKFMRYGMNPTDFLCSRFGEAHTDIWWEFEGLFQPSREYQDCLMAFLHEMNEDLCANSIDDSSEGYLFRCMPNNEDNPYATHCMAMQVSHADPDGGYYYRWENVYAGWSFLNFNDFSGAERINVNGSSDMLDAVATQALSGQTPDIETYRSWLKQSMSDVGVTGTPWERLKLDWSHPFTTR